MVDDTREARAIAVRMRAQLTRSGARCSKREGLHLIGVIERLATIIEARQAELPELVRARDLYAALVEDYNGIVAALRAIGIEVAQPAGSDAWHWRYGGRGGQAATIPAAYAAALNVYEELL